MMRGGYFRCVVNDSVGPCVIDVGGGFCSPFNIWVDRQEEGESGQGLFWGKGL